jgi:TonB family protein
MPASVQEPPHEDRREAARIEAAQPPGERPVVPAQEASRAELDKEKAERQEALLRAAGRQLDEEAAQREAAASTAPRLPNTLPLSLSTARRVRLWGHTHPNAALVEYGEAWARKIELNTPVETVREVANQSHRNPVVTVAIRSDGSVESVTFVLSSGVPEVDEAIRRIVESHRPYPPFPPALAREFDVVEIRRIWYFDSAVRLH